MMDSVPSRRFGCAIALAADFVLAAETAYFLQPFTRIGLAADGGPTMPLALLIGKARTMEMLLLGERISARQAETWWLIYCCVEEAALLTEAELLSRRLAAGSILAMGLTRTCVAAAIGDIDSAVAREADAQRTAANSQDVAEGTWAVTEKRKPVFRGA